MKKVFFSLLAVSAIFFAGEKASAQQMKVGVFDIDAMVTAMPAYRDVDSMLNIYQTDSLATEYQFYFSEYKRLDSTYGVDSGLVAQGKLKPATLDYIKTQRQQMYVYLVNWQTIGQRKLEAKKGQLAQGLYTQVETAYRKVLDAKKYFIVLKPGAYEFGPHIDNIFISVAKELKLTSLPQEFLVLGEDPDAPAQQQQPVAPKTPAKQPAH